MGIPQQAIDRYLRLEQKADDLRAARMEAYRVWEHAREEAARLDGSVRSCFPGLHVEIDDDGTVYHTEFRPGQPRMVGHAILRDGDRHHKRVVGIDAGTQQRIQVLLAARRRLSQANEHRQRLDATGHGLSRLVEQCEKALRRRGWTPSGGREMTGSGAGVAR
jgi:hypothetical protein